MQRKSFPVSKAIPRVAITYNSVVGGVTVNCIKAVMKELNTNVVDADYRVIVEKDENLEKIYGNPAMLSSVIKKGKKEAKEMLKNVDCLMISGAGPMIDPRLYGARLQGEEIDLARSLGELILLHVAIQKGMPVLGVCGGHQLINVYLGGKLEALTPNQLQEQGFQAYGTVMLNAQSLLAKMIYKNKPINSSQESFWGAHKQAISTIGNEFPINNKENFLQCSASSNDSKFHIEAIESVYGSLIVGIQFHAEVGVKGIVRDGILQFQAIDANELKKNLGIFEAFKQAAEGYQCKRNVTDHLARNARFYQPATVEGVGTNSKSTLNVNIANAPICRALKETETVAENETSTPTISTLPTKSM